VPQKKRRETNLKSGLKATSATATADERSADRRSGRGRPLQERGQLLPKRPSTKSILMEAGELLISRHGFDGVSLREIASFAGQGHNNAVKYYFQNKEGLVHAILINRLQQSEKVRRAQFAALKAKGKDDDPRELLAILWLPALADDEEVACRFVLQCMLKEDIAAYYPLEKYSKILDLPKKQGKNIDSVFPEVLGLLRAKYTNLPVKVFFRRLAALTYMFVSCVVAYHTHRSGKEGRPFDAGPVLDMAVVALSAKHAQ
jgi:AcrR family transcriptional regulator